MVGEGAESDDFEEGRCWAQYTFMEGELLDFMKYVPYTEENSKVYSPRLAELLLEACGYIDSIFKIMNGFKSFKENEGFQERIEDIKSKKDKSGRAKKKRTSIDDWLEIFEKPYNLSISDGAILTAKLKWHGLQQMQPFKYPCSSKACRIPDWWHIYNLVKHKWTSSTVKKASLRCILHALAGAFLLNALHYPSIRFLWKEGILEIGAFYQRGTRWTEVEQSDEEFSRSYDVSIRNMRSFNETYRIETELFLFTHLKQTKENSPKEEASKSKTDVKE